MFKSLSITPFTIFYLFLSLIYLFSVEWSKYFDMTTVGLTGAIELKIEGDHMQEGPRGSSKIASFGIIIENGAHPFMKTKIIKIVPRYIVFNNMNEALVIKQKNGVQLYTIMP